MSEAHKMPAEQSPDSALEDALIASGKLDRTNLERARRMARSSGESLVIMIPKLGMVSERDMAGVLAELLERPLLDTAMVPPEPILKDRLSARFLRQSHVLPIEENGTALTCAMANPLDSFALDALKLVWGGEINIAVGEPSAIEAAVDRLYSTDDSGGIESLAGEESENLEPDVERLKDLASEAPVIRLVNQLIADAVERRASDIHIEAFEESLRVRMRIDGVLVDVDPPSARHRAAVVSRLKIMAKLNIAERRLPQDGRIKLAIKGTPIDLRVSTIPTLHGEGVVLRVLDREGVALDFERLGIDGVAAQQLGKVLAEPHGIFLVTGPTGSGKTTTLYAALVGLNNPERKILTVEDPIEYQLDGINQVQVKPAIGLSFANVLRSFLRQDPDIMMVGEIRDKETAEIAVQAALTGHLVLSTLHTNDAAGAITRLLDMGVDDYLLTSTVTGVAAQRLVRRLCQACRQPDPLSRDVMSQLKIDQGSLTPDAQLYKAIGCDACNGTGYRGRSCVLEVLVVSDEIRRLVLQQAEVGEIHRQAVTDGMVSMFQNGLAKALQGVTTLDEVLRVTREV